ncbi:MAG: DsbA family oxidoreductase [Alphaproteobacteria bacterium]|jgi:predicted DsbA family dithiol-disulfide isomerase|nr:DsbA family oxidoreductase [Alphaproteobacteria bacterium]
MNVDIFFDPICPWCFIGKHRFDAALAQRPQAALERRWLPFQLNPTMPPGGMDRRSYAIAKFGGPERARRVIGMIAETAAKDGLEMRLDEIRRTPNTLDAHRLVRVAAREGIALETAIDALFRAYFQDLRDIGDRAELVAIGADLGLDRGFLGTWLDSDEEVEAVRSADGLARRIGVQGVPCFVFDGRYALAGAQEPQAFLPLLDLAGTDTEAATTPV